MNLLALYSEFHEWQLREEEREKKMKILLVFALYDAFLMAVYILC
jgi:hypothetical protein